jgi:hypothetical protein
MAPFVAVAVAAWVLRRRQPLWPLERAFSTIPTARCRATGVGRVGPDQRRFLLPERPGSGSACRTSVGGSRRGSWRAALAHQPERRHVLGGTRAIGGRFGGRSADPARTTATDSAHQLIGMATPRCAGPVQQAAHHRLTAFHRDTPRAMRTPAGVVRRSRMRCGFTPTRRQDPGIASEGPLRGLRGLRRCRSSPTAAIPCARAKWSLARPERGRSGVGPPA